MFVFRANCGLNTVKAAEPPYEIPVVCGEFIICMELVLLALLGEMPVIAQ